MKGITEQIAGLGLGEIIEIQDTERSNIYAIAKRKGVRVSVRKSDNGYTVARVSEIVSHTSEPEAAELMPKEWIDIGEHWNEITGEMVAMEKHYKTGVFREKQ